MTPDEILVGLHDVIPPDSGPDIGVTMLSPWPFVIATLLILILAGLSRHRATAWRREARAALANSDMLPSGPRRAEELGVLFRRVARHTPPGQVPALLMRPAESASAEDLTALRARIAEMIR